MVLGIDLFANGQTTVDGHTVQTDADFLLQIHEANAGDPDLRAVLRADASISHGRVIHTLDLLKQAGIERIAFGVTPVGGGAAPRPTTSAPSSGSAAGVRAGQDWNCPFPAAADAEHIDTATVILIVAVDVSATPRWVRVLRDPGYGFGQAATACALARQYIPARDKNGATLQAMTPPIRMKFAR